MVLSTICLATFYFRDTLIASRFRSSGYLLLRRGSIDDEYWRLCTGRRTRTGSFGALLHTPSPQSIRCDDIERVFDFSYFINSDKKIINACPASYLCDTAIVSVGRRGPPRRSSTLCIIQLYYIRYTYVNHLVYVLVRARKLKLFMFFKLCIGT